MLAALQRAGQSTASAGVALQAAPDLFAGPLGTLLLALVVVAVILFVGRYVLSVAWRVLKVAIVVVALVWLVVTVAPMVAA